jgi:hypothetical protein
MRSTIHLYDALACRGGEVWVVRATVLQRCESSAAMGLSGSLTTS